MMVSYSITKSTACLTSNTGLENIYSDVVRITTQNQEDHYSANFVLPRVTSVRSFRKINKQFTFILPLLLFLLGVFSFP
jgi:hypothetical protein